MHTYGKDSKADKTALKTLITATGLIAFMAACVGQKRNSEVTKARNELGFGEFLNATGDVLAGFVSKKRGRPALEEQPVHSVIKGIREAARVFADSENQDRAVKVLAKALKKAESEERHLGARRELYAGSKRIQGTRRFEGVYSVPLAPQAKEA